MDAQSGCNEGFRMLDDFVCEATPASGVPLAISPGSGVNAGIALSDADVHNSHSRSGTLLVEELRSLNAAQIHAFIEFHSEISLEELRLILDIVIDKLKQDKPQISEDAKKILRESMLVLLNENVS
jgi:hypothetical protein